jgi:4-amino-4-deoxychorismate lyase
VARWFHNGSEITEISVDDRGLQYADGLFETVALRKGQPRLWGLHSGRMQTGCRRLGINIPPPDELLRALTAVVDATGNSTQDALLKIIVTRGAGQRGYAPPRNARPTIVFGVFKAAPRAAESYQAGVSVRFCNTRLATQPQTAGMKLLSRLDQVLACSEWNDPDIAEGLMLDQEGFVVSGTTSNLFLVTGSTLITPEITKCGVSGIMRQHILALATEHELPFVVERVSVDRVNTANEVFLSNSQFGILPVSNCGGSRIDDWPLTRKLSALLRTSGVVEGPE